MQQLKKRRITVCNFAVSAEREFLLLLQLAASSHLSKLKAQLYASLGGSDVRPTFQKYELMQDKKECAKRTAENDNTALKVAYFCGKWPLCATTAFFA